MNEEDDDDPTPKRTGRPKRFVPPDDAEPTKRPKGSKSKKAVGDKEELPKFPVIALGWEGSLGQSLAANGIGRTAQVKSGAPPVPSGARSSAVRQSLLHMPTFGSKPRRQADAGWVEATDVRSALIAGLRTLGRKSGPPSLSGQRDDIEMLTDDGGAWWAPDEKVYAFDPAKMSGKAAFKATIADLRPGRDRDTIIKGLRGGGNIPMNYPEEAVSLREFFIPEEED